MSATLTFRSRCTGGERSEEREFSASRTAPLIPSILDGQVKTVEEADRFLTGLSGAPIE